jgi:hypothetical protein
MTYACKISMLKLTGRYCNSYFFAYFAAGLAASFGAVFPG